MAARELGQCWVSLFSRTDGHCAECKVPAARSLMWNPPCCWSVGSRGLCLKIVPLVTAGGVLTPSEIWVSCSQPVTPWGPKAMASWLQWGPPLPHRSPAGLCGRFSYPRASLSLTVIWGDKDGLVSGWHTLLGGGGCCTVRGSHAPLSNLETLFRPFQLPCMEGGCPRHARRVF